MAKSTRRALLAFSLFALSSKKGLAAAGEPPGRQLAFEVWREGQHIGRHTIDFRNDPDRTIIAVIEADILVKFGPVPIYRYRHRAEERWVGGNFVSLTSQTVTNGRREQVSATREGGVTAVTTLRGAHRLADNVLPLTHWNVAALNGPLFNPETGALLREQITRAAGQTVRLANGQAVAATRYTLSGEVEIVDWYDAADVWTALRGKAPDGSYIEYRRSA